MEPRVLVVEDDQVALKLLVEVLEREGYEVVPAEGGGEALSKAASFRPQVVVTDLRLGDADGLSVLRDLKALEPPVSQLMSGWSVRVSLPQPAPWVHGAATEST